MNGNSSGVEEFGRKANDCSGPCNSFTELNVAQALSLNMETLPGDVTVGSIVSYMSVDASNIAMLFQNVHFCFTIPVQISLTLYLLYWNIGWAGPASLAVILLLFPIMGSLGKLSGGFQKRLLAQNDVRLKLINELLQVVADADAVCGVPCEGLLPRCARGANFGYIPGDPPGDNCSHQEASTKEQKLPGSLWDLLATVKTNLGKQVLCLQLSFARVLWAVWVGASGDGAPVFDHQ